ncbi:hypothetical protein [Gimesia panareensis]|uniref:hypothetical protein n=1 Tax=Gimesia panareensis TaxID=2527978 RepID=UPI0018D5D1A6|nr:hypothetical protein [Gimesia panareensis]
MAETNAKDVGKIFALEAGGGIALGFVLGLLAYSSMATSLLYISHALPAEWSK